MGTLISLVPFCLAVMIGGDAVATHDRWKSLSLWLDPVAWIAVLLALIGVVCVASDFLPVVPFIQALLEREMG